MGCTSGDYGEDGWPVQSDLLPGGIFRTHMTPSDKEYTIMTIADHANKRFTLREAIESTAFQLARDKSRVVIPIGRRVDGGLEVLDLHKTPNLLVAGSVTSGKTAFVHCVIASLATCNRADEVQLLLDDVTRVELVSYNELPHMVRPTVVELRETIATLGWLETQINIRSQELVRPEKANIDAHRQHELERPMPHLVLVIYELADLMLCEPDLAEPLICRLARSAPDAGVHLIIATQRPSPDVITARVKANFPARACFNVVSPKDSRVILDMEGAERLGEDSDMLFLSPESSTPMRIQGCSISEAEIDSLEACGNLGPKPNDES